MIKISDLNYHDLHPPTLQHDTASASSCVYVKIVNDTWFDK